MDIQIKYNDSTNNVELIDGQTVVARISTNSLDKDQAIKIAQEMVDSYDCIDLPSSKDVDMSNMDMIFSSLGGPHFDQLVEMFPERTLAEIKELLSIWIVQGGTIHPSPSPIGFKI